MSAYNTLYEEAAENYGLSIMDERLIEAANRARDLGLVLPNAHKQLIQKLSHAH